MSRRWDAICFSDVRFPVEGHRHLTILSTHWHLVVRGKVAIALGPRLTQAWRQGGCIEHTSRSRQQRTLLLRIPRQGMTKGVSIVSVYAPQSGVPVRITKQDFWDQLSTTLRATKSDDITVVGGDFNADIASQSHLMWPRIVGQWGATRTSPQGRDLLNWCSQHDFLVADTFFSQPLRKRYTWWHPARRTGHGLDHFLVKGHSRRFIDSARTVHEGRRGNAGEPLGRRIAETRLTGSTGMTSQITYPLNSRCISGLSPRRQPHHLPTASHTLSRKLNDWQSQDRPRASSARDGMTFSTLALQPRNTPTAPSLGSSSRLSVWKLARQS